MLDKPDLDPKSQGSMLSYLPRCQGLLTGSAASSECLFQGLYWRVYHQMFCAIFGRGLRVAENVGRSRELDRVRSVVKDDIVVSKAEI